LIYGKAGNHWRAVSRLMLASVASAIMVIFFPETASAELDPIFGTEPAFTPGILQDGARRVPPRDKESRRMLASVRADLFFW
jgi:hypothetical protein